ncbi:MULTISPECIES: type 1 glutamine amidotransferase domain-containing protein [unclassified Nocardia]|uniref:type 1 glutamine amidotransferase domain-containing protein n=1 Tax=unclassified Nocardia TaxID=2637762 RepID=UPI001CE3DA09|nr:MULTISPECIES: type 1 glutamine amidotransferase domain-containing protein [unclassified Nocardia]
MRAILAMTSCDRIGDRPTGAYASELADAWKVFRDNGFQVDTVSVRGGRPPLEAIDERDPVQRAFFRDPQMRTKLAHTARPSEIEPAAILFLAGGHGAALDFPDATDLAHLIRRHHEAGSVIATVCHGPAALLNAGTLVVGKKITCFTNAEERAVGMTRHVPYLLADELAARGADITTGPSFLPHVITDGHLITGQNPASATEVATRAAHLATTATPQNTHLPGDSS